MRPYYDNNRVSTRDINVYGNEYSKNDELFDSNYIALLTILSIVLGAYGLDLNEKQNQDNYYMIKTIDKIEEKIEKLEGKMGKIERLLERSVYCGK